MKPSISTLLTPLILSGALLLSACNTAALLQQKYPDRETFHREDDDGDTFSYLCDKKASDAETEQNVDAAHAYILRQMDEISSNTIGKVIENEFQSEEPTSKVAFMGAFMSQSMKMNTQVETLFKAINTKYGCLVIDVDE